GFVGLLYEGGDRVDVVVTERGPGPYIAVAGLRRGRTNAERDDAPVLRGVTPDKTRGAEQLEIENDVIGGEREHDRRGAGSARDRCRRRDGRGGIAAHRLEHDGRIEGEFLRLPAGKEPERVGRHDDRRSKQGLVAQARE